MQPDYEKFNPVRTASWRSDRVLKLLEDSPRSLKPLRYRDDGYIHRYYKFLLRYQAAVSEQAPGIIPD